MMAYARLVLMCLLLFLALTENVEPSNIVLGTLIGILVAVILKPAPENLSIRRLPVALFSLARYSVWLAIDIIRNGIRVARIVLDPKLPIRPGILAIRSEMKSELGIALNAHAITVTPGEQVVEIGDDGTLYTHCLDVVASAADAEEAQRTRRRLMEGIFE